MTAAAWWGLAVGLVGAIATGTLSAYVHVRAGLGPATAVCILGIMAATSFSTLLVLAGTT